MAREGIIVQVFARTYLSSRSVGLDRCVGVLRFEVLHISTEYNSMQSNHVLRKSCFEFGTSNDSEPAEHHLERTERSMSLPQTIVG
jgi:hypothetical protein